MSYVPSTDSTSTNAPMISQMLESLDEAGLGPAMVGELWQSYNQARQHESQAKFATEGQAGEAEIPADMGHAGAGSGALGLVGRLLIVLRLMYGQHQQDAAEASRPAGVDPSVNPGVKPDPSSNSDIAGDHDDKNSHPGGVTDQADLDLSGSGGGRRPNANADGRAVVKGEDPPPCSGGAAIGGEAGADDGDGGVKKRALTPPPVDGRNVKVCGVTEGVSSVTSPSAVVGTEPPSCDGDPPGFWDAQWGGCKKEEEEEGGAGVGIGPTDAPGAPRGGAKASSSSGFREGGGGTAAERAAPLTPPHLQPVCTAASSTAPGSSLAVPAAASAAAPSSSGRPPPPRAPLQPCVGDYRMVVRREARQQGGHGSSGAGRGEGRRGQRGR